MQGIENGSRHATGCGIGEVSRHSRHYGFRGNADQRVSVGADTAVPGTTPDSAVPSTGASPLPSAPAQSEVTRVDQFVAREIRKQRGSIDIVTAEGDQVSIRFKTKEVVNGSVTQTTAADGTTVTDTRASLISRGRLQVEVDGDLNEEELAAIGELLTKVDEIATKFFSGDVQAAFAAASELGVDSEQIASYQLDFTYSRKMAAAAWSAARAGAASLPALGPSTQPPAESSTSAGSSAGVSAGSEPSTSPTVASTAPALGVSPPQTPDASAATGTTEDPAPSSETPTPPAATAQKTITHFIGDVLSKLGSVDGAGRFSFSMRWKVDVLVTALETLPAPAATTPAEQESAATNTALLGDALQKAVA
jgi:hypothetical protein